MRVLAGYWTHGGYVNWDTGFGFRRWHQAKKLGLSQQALIGIATAPGLAPRPNAPAWAKWMLDRGFEFYERQLARDGDEPPGLFFGVHELPQPAESARLALARMSLQRGARDRGRARLRAREGAAAAVRVRPRHGAAGGHDGRLQHRDRPEQPRRVPVRRDRPRPALRRPPGGRGRDRRAAAGVVRAARARHLRPAHVRAASSRTAAGCGSRRRRTACARAARRGRAARTPARSRTCARPGSRAGAAGWRARATASPRSSCRRPGRCGGRARAGRASGGRAVPELGRGRAGDAVLRGGGTRRLGTVRVPLRRVAHLRVESRNGAYVVLPRTRPRGATVHLLHPRPQSSAPLAGPTLAVQLVRERRVRTAPLQRPLRPRGKRAGRGDRGPHGKVSGGGAPRPADHARSPRRRARRISGGAAPREPASPG